MGFVKNEVTIDATLRLHLEVLLNQLGELTWAYVVLSKDDLSCVQTVSNFPDKWVRRYREMELQYTDPVIMTALKQLTPFFWDENIMVYPGCHSDKLFSQSGKFGIRSGYTFVLHDYKNNLATLTFVIPSRNKTAVMQTLIKNKGDISGLLASVHETFLTLTSSSEENHNHSAETMFTFRENEILYWMSMGKTYEETGIILGIKICTVKFYMSGIVKKMGVANDLHAVRLALELQLIKPVG